MSGYLWWSRRSTNWERTLVPIAWETRWAPEPVCTFWRWEKYFAPAGNWTANSPTQLWHKMCLNLCTSPSKLCNYSIPITWNWSRPQKLVAQICTRLKGKGCPALYVNFPDVYLVKVSPVLAIQVRRWSRGIAPLILNLSTRWMWVVNFHSQAALLTTQQPSY
jgi:hypothetical protein